MARRTSWGVELDVKTCPVPKLVTYPERGIYGWKIDKHGILALGDSKAACIDNFKASYLAETGTLIQGDAHV